MPPRTPRILATHVGSLPRPADLLDLMKAKLEGAAWARWRRTLALVALLGLAGCVAPGGNPSATFHSSAERLEPFVTPDGIRLPLRRYAAEGQSRAVLLALHGFNDYGGAFERPARYFAREGIETLAYDQRGFGGAPGRGHWAGTEALVGDFRAVLDRVRRERPQIPVFVLGESMGGAVIAVALAGDKDSPVAGAILVTPAIWARDAMPWYQRFGIWLGARLMPGAGLSSRDYGLIASDNAEALAESASDPMTIHGTRFDTLEGLTDLMDEAMRALPRMRTRTLVVYGQRDVLMPREAMTALLERWPQHAGENFRFGLYPEGYHLLLRDLQRNLVCKDIVSWMLEPQARLPSGLERNRLEVLNRLSTAAAASGLVLSGGEARSPGPEQLELRPEGGRF